MGFFICYASYMLDHVADANRFSETLGFRRKQALRVVAEIRELVDRYGPHPLQFTDNISSHDYFADLLPGWARWSLIGLISDDEGILGESSRAVLDTREGS